MKLPEMKGPNEPGYKVAKAEEGSVVLNDLTGSKTGVVKLRLHSLQSEAICDDIYRAVPDGRGEQDDE